MADRGPNGHFAPGNSVGKMPKRGSARANLELIRNETDNEAVLALWIKILGQAMDGCDKSQKIALEYLCGKPSQALELQGIDNLTKLFDVAMGDAMEKA